MAAVEPVVLVLGDVFLGVALPRVLEHDHLVGVVVLLVVIGLRLTAVVLDPPRPERVRRHAPVASARTPAR